LYSSLQEAIALKLHLANLHTHAGAMIVSEPWISVKVCYCTLTLTALQLHCI